MCTLLCSLAHFVVLAAAVFADPFDHCLCRSQVLDCSDRTPLSYYQYPRGEQSTEDDGHDMEDHLNDPARSRIPYIHVDSLCPNATTVHLQYLRLREFPYGLQNVSSIDVSSNSLTSIPDASLVGSNTKYLDLSNNEIANASQQLRSLGALEELRLGWNRLSHLRFLPSPCRLRRLDARVNFVTSVEGPLRRCSQLRTLFLFAANITELPDDALSGMLQLREMVLYGNPIASLSERSFSGLPELEILDLRSTLLTSLPERVFVELRRLQALKLDNNRFQTLPNEAFNGLAELRSLYLSQALRNVTTLPEDLFSPLTNLRQLYLDHNGLTSLPNNLFQRLEKLEELHLESNKLQRIPGDAFDSLGNLRTLRLDRNDLTVLPDSLFPNLRSLRHVDASFNSLTALPDLGACCASLGSASFTNNSVVVLGESSARALLGGGGRDVDLHENPVRASALRWVLGATDVQPFARSRGDCACGGLRSGGSVLRFCVDAPCGGRSAFRDWIAALGAANDVH